MAIGKSLNGKPLAKAGVRSQRALAVRRLMAGIVGVLLCWHVGATTEGALRISHSSDSTEWIAAKSAQIPTTASGGGDQPCSEGKGKVGKC